MKTVRVKEIFEVKYGVNLELSNIESSLGDVPFIGRTEKNNGMTAKVKLIEGISPNPENTISVAGGGSVMSCFLQKKPYYSGRDLYYLKPKIKLSDNEMLYYCMCLRANKYRYSYGRQANRTLKDLEIPTIESIPNWVYEIKMPEVDKTPILNKKIELNIKEWKYFNLSSVFKIEKCKCNNANALLKEGKDIFYIGAKKNDNGIMRMVEKDASLETKGNCIVFIGDGQGSVGYALYQPYSFIGSSTLCAGYNKNLNKYNALFIVNILDAERYRYSFGRKYGKAIIEKSSIKLPVNEDGNPNWQFMEDYIKSLPFSKNM